MIMSMITKREKLNVKKFKTNPWFDSHLRYVHPGADYIKMLAVDFKILNWRKICNSTLPLSRLPTASFLYFPLCSIQCKLLLHVISVLLS